MTGNDRPAAVADRREPVRSPTPARRQVLKGLAAAPSAAALAGCQFGPAPDDETADARQPVDLTVGERAGYGEVVRFGPAYAMAVTTADASGTTAMTGRFHYADRYVRFEQDTAVVETYLVDGVGYVVIEGECTRYPGLDRGVTGSRGIPASAAAAAPDPTDVTLVRTTTIDGRQILVLETADTETAGTEAGMTYYVDAATRYPRRVTAGATTVHYHSWEAVEPIAPPAVDCREG